MTVNRKIFFRRLGNRGSRDLRQWLAKFPVFSACAIFLSLSGLSARDNIDTRADAKFFIQANERIKYMVGLNPAVMGDSLSTLKEFGAEIGGYYRPFHNLFTKVDYRLRQSRAADASMGHYVGAELTPKIAIGGLVAGLRNRFGGLLNAPSNPEGTKSYYSWSPVPRLEYFFGGARPRWSLFTQLRITVPMNYGDDPVSRGYLYGGGAFIAESFVLPVYYAFRKNFVSGTNDHLVGFAVVALVN